MKLYSKHQLLKSLVIGVFTGVALTVVAGTAYQRARAAQPEAAGGGQGAGTGAAEELPVAAGGDGAEAPAVKMTASAKDSVSYTQEEIQNITVYERCNEAVVNITTQEMALNWFFEPSIQEGGSGSGSIIDKNGYVVTNYHVIENATEINISLYDGSTFTGKVVGTDKESDIAVLKFDPPKDVILKTIDFGNSGNLKVGQKVIAIGNPFALERTMTTGIISGLGRPVQESKNVIIRNMIQTDAAINPGNSGGPLLDTAGRMIGINTVIITGSEYTSGSVGIGFAIPVSTALRVVNDLIQYGRVNRGRLSITPVQMTNSIASYAGIGINYGILVSAVKQGSKTAASGLRGGTKAVQYGSRRNPTTIYLGGDIITAIDRISVQSYADFTSALEEKRPGDVVTVTVYRNGKFEKLTVTLDSDDTTARTL